MLDWDKLKIRFMLIVLRYIMDHSGTSELYDQSTNLYIDLKKFRGRE